MRTVIIFLLVLLSASNATAQQTAVQDAVEKTIGNLVVQTIVLKEQLEAAQKEISRLRAEAARKDGKE